ncbi:uncharacterized protein LOC141679521 [Apium graveolens]|uniref:uncharacterized protein LOC141679521 n=1 Tax=Apium graveolens TaxID=4045 RepID=UPI003D79CC44
MSLALSSKNKLGFVTGKFKIPAKFSAYFDHWQRFNAIVITRILNSIIPKFRSSLVFIPIDMDVWSDIHARYTQSNGPRIFDLKRALNALNQETLSVSAYYTKFKMLWDDFVNVANMPKYSCPCLCKARSQLEQYDEIMKVTQFLIGFNELYTHIRGQFLMTNFMLKLTRLLALLQQEERQRNHVNLAQPIIESTVLMTKTIQNMNFRSNVMKDEKTPEFRKSEN